MKKPVIGITIGDINGVGPEVIIKTLNNSKVLDMCTPVIFGSSKVLSYHKNIVKAGDFNYTVVNNLDNVSRHKTNVVNCSSEDVTISLGQITEEAGKFAYVVLDRAVQEINNGKIDALVTAPINKKAMQLANFPNTGHTEFLTEKTGMSESLMVMTSETMRVAVATNHIPVSEVAEKLTKEKLQRKLQIFNKSLKNDFGIEKPTIAVLGLNPHAGDGGAIGTEEEEMIRPLIIEAKKKGAMILGPFSADGFFGSSQFKKVDGIMAMYHDQGLIPFKALSFGNGTNFTAGLPIVRTSPDHGTAFDIAGKNKADASSFRNALFNAIDIVRCRKSEKEMRENSMEKNPKLSEKVEE